ncbi:hypothetical protein JYU20_00435 [Bacteroidales bacterium AH-315-I05]|nr:hypothetical protein [Bacteroidales bacterium AH-315-I05]
MDETAKKNTDKTAKKKNPILGALLNVAINTASGILSGTVFKDKKKKAEAGEEAGGQLPLLKPTLFSSKRVLNFGGSTAIIGTGLFVISTAGVSTAVVILVGIGAAYSLGMTWITMKSEK